jgi:hypothetical protein
MTTEVQERDRRLRNAVEPVVATHDLSTEDR